MATRAPRAPWARWLIRAVVSGVVIAILLGHNGFKYKQPNMYGACGGVRTTTDARGMNQYGAKRKVPAIG